MKVIQASARDGGMDRLALEDSESRFAAFVESLNAVMAIATGEGRFAITALVFLPAACARASSRWL